MSTMFTADDVRELTRAFPPLKSSGGRLDQSGSEPSFLIPSASYDGFIVSSSARKYLLEIIDTGLHRIPLSSLVDQLDVRKDVISELLGEEYFYGILDYGGNFIIPGPLRDRLREQLQDLAHEAPISVSHFCEEYDISHKGLLRLHQEICDADTEAFIPDALTVQYDPTLKHSASMAAEWIISHIYHVLLELDVRTKMETVYQKAERLTLQPDQLPGNPPLFLITNTVDKLINELPGDYRTCEGKLDYTPQTLAWPTVYEVLEQLASGTMDFYDMYQITENVAFQEWLHLRDVQDNACGLYPQQILLFNELAVSKSWFDKRIDSELDRIKETPVISLLDHAGYLSRVSDEAMSEFFDAVKGALSAAAPMEIEYIPHEGGWLAARKDWLNGLDALVEEHVVQQARNQWDRLIAHSHNDCELDPAALLDAVVSGQAYGNAARDLIMERIEAFGKAAFDAEVSRLERESLEQFSALWHERVESRFQLYKAGAEAISDDKLRSQLLDLLHTHIRTELIPETLSRAEAKGLLRGKRLRRNVRNFKTSLGLLADKDTSTAATTSNTPPLSLETLTTALSKFATKLSPPPTIPSLAAAKSAYLSDTHHTIRTLDRDKDGPRLFLALVVVLLAKQQDGVVYATGKFAPKLMRLLKGKVSEEVYARLEALKEGVKSGKASKEEREEMKGLAGDGDGDGDGRGS